jgi:hypothetical protein
MLILSTSIAERDSWELFSTRSPLTESYEMRDRRIESIIGELISSSTDTSCEKSDFGEEFFGRDLELCPIARERS